MQFTHPLKQDNCRI